MALLVVAAELGVPEDLPAVRAGVAAAERMDFPSVGSEREFREEEEGAAVALQEEGMVWMRLDVGEEGLTGWERGQAAARAAALRVLIRVGRFHVGLCEKMVYAGVGF